MKLLMGRRIFLPILNPSRCLKLFRLWCLRGWISSDVNMFWLALTPSGQGRSSEEEMKSGVVLAFLKKLLFISVLMFVVWDDPVLTWREANMVWFHWGHVKSAWLQGSSPLACEILLVLWQDWRRTHWRCFGHHLGGTRGFTQDEHYHDLL